MPSKSDILAGRYQILTTEAEGGLSRVRKGLDLSTETFVAIKYIENMPDPLITVDVWEQEIRSLKMLKSPDVVRFIDGGFDKIVGKHYIVVEWLEESLADKLSRISKIDTLQKWNSFAQRLLYAVANIHSKNIFHRDIKPDNIMFRSKVDDDFDVVLIDFGIAKDDEIKGERTLKDFRTPVFSPPNPGIHDNFRRDLFSVAMVLIQVLTAKRFADRQDAVAFLDELRVRKFPVSIISVLEKALNLEDATSYSSVIEFREAYLAAIVPLVTPKQKLDLNLILTDQPRAYPSDEDSRSISMQDFYENLFSNDGYFAYGDSSYDTSAILMFIGGYQLKLAAQAEGLRSYLIVRTIKKIDDINYYNRKVQKALDVNKFLTFKLCDSKRDSKRDANGAESVETLLKKLDKHSFEIESSASEPGDRFYVWKNILQAREQFILKRYKPIEFKKAKVLGRVFEIEADLNDGLIEVESCWEIEGLSGQYFLFEGSFGEKLSFKSTRILPDLPASGRMVPSIRSERPSLTKQRNALDDIVAGIAVNPELAEQIRRPKSVPNLQSNTALSFQDDKVDDEKRDAITRAIASEGFFVVEGPPGTGKTSFISELIRQFSTINPRGRVLLVSQTNVAVDNALERLEGIGFDSLVRVGRVTQEKVSAKTVHMLVDNRARQWSAVAEFTSKEFLEKMAKENGFDPVDLQRVKILSDLVESIEFLESPVAKPWYEEAPLKTFYELQNDLTINKHLSEPDVSDANKVDRKEINEMLRSAGYGINFAASLTKDSAKSEIERIKSKGSQLSWLVDLAIIQNDWVLKIPSDKNLKTRFIKNSKVIAGTCIGFLGLQEVADLEFDLCIIDEVSKATATEALVPISRAKRTVLVGDSNQLPPNEEDLLTESEIITEFELTEAVIKETLFDVMRKFLPESNKAMLRRQYRMVPEIGNLVSECFYANNLISMRSSDKSTYREVIGKPVRWLSTTVLEGRGEIRNGYSFENRLEAREAVSHLIELNTWAQSRSKNESCEKLDVLVITPYLAQKRAIQERLAHIACGELEVRVETFDAVQGVECDYSIISLVRSNKTGSFGFVGAKYWRRLNVALSRAKHGVSVIGDFDFCSSKPGHMLEVIKYMQSHPEDCEVRAV